MCRAKASSPRPLCFFFLQAEDGIRVLTVTGVQTCALPIFGIEAVLHYTCRDRNVLCIQSDLLGAAATGIRNLICITGDPPKMGNYPDATAVFDVDAIGLVNIVQNLNRGLDIGGNPIGIGTSFVIGVGANPGVPNLDE